VKGIAFRPKHFILFPLRIDFAASECNIVVPMDGIVGNFVCRSLAYLGGATLVGGFTLTNRFVSLDTSRSNDRFCVAIQSAVAMANVGGMPVEEYTG
jgi:predicted methyltransferase MtxX (methanogen marker protein 4)